MNRSNDLEINESGSTSLNDVQIIVYCATINCDHLTKFLTQSQQAFLCISKFGECNVCKQALIKFWVWLMHRSTKTQEKCCRIEMFTLFWSQWKWQLYSSNNLPYPGAAERVTVTYSTYLKMSFKYFFNNSLVMS